MKFEEKKIAEKGRGLWNVTIEGKEWEDAVNKGKKNAAAGIQIPGFRKGKAPKSRVEALLTPSKYLNEALKAVLESAWNFAKDQKSSLEPFNSPVPAPKEISDKYCVIEFAFDLKPEIKIGEYKNLKSDDLKKESATPTDEEIENAIKQYRNKFAMEKIREDDAEIQIGDVVTFDFEGFIDEVAFIGGKGNDHKLEIGSGQFIPGFEDSMTGLKKGKHNIDVTFPEDYTPELAGKKAEFRLDIKEIKEKVLPNKDDELAKDLNIKGVSTFPEFEEYIKTQIEKQKTTQLKNVFVNKVIEKIKETSKIEIPKIAIDKEVENLFKEFEARVAGQKLTMKEYKKQTGMSDTDIRNELFGDAKARLESYLITDEVRNKEKFEAEESEIDKKFQDLSDQFGMKVEELKNVILPVEQVKEEIIKEKLINFLYENNGN